jgi:hypothetical protein
VVTHFVFFFSFFHFFLFGFGFEEEKEEEEGSIVVLGVMRGKPRVSQVVLRSSGRGAITRTFSEGLKG